MITFQTESRKLVKVLRDGVFAGWLEQGYHKPTGIATKGYTYWSALINGRTIQGVTLTAAKAKITAHG